MWCRWQYRNPCCHFPVTLNSETHVSSFYVLMIFGLMTKGSEHLTFEGRLTYEERAGIILVWRREGSEEILYIYINT